MKWTNDKSIKLSIILVFAFGIILLLLDIIAVELVRELTISRGMERFFTLFLVSIYSGSIFGWICLYDLYRLLKNIKKEEIFTLDNISLLRAISWCCGAACLLSLLSCLYYFPFFFIAICSGFMMLIVRIVKNIFQQAYQMKNDLDLTI